MVQEDFAFRSCFEDVDLVGGFGGCEVAVHARNGPGEVQVVAWDIRDDRQSRQVERAVELDDFGVRQVEFFLQKRAHARMDVVGDFQADGRAEAAAAEFFFQRLEQVFGFVFFDFHVFVAGDAEERIADNLHAFEKGVELCGDEVFDRDEAGGVFW